MQNNTLVKTAISTPTAQQEGRVVTIKLAKLATYEINVRSFHPGKDFGWSGAWFEGDARGFSLKNSSKSGASRPEITSRIWQRFQIDTATAKVLNLETESNTSGRTGKEKISYDGVLKPRGGTWPVVRKEGSQVVTLSFEGGFAGENHAVIFSARLKKLFGGTPVPSLNVDYSIIMTVDRISKHLDIVTYAKGDAFPNCEAFIVDPKGVAVFLGVHVRFGAAITSLPFDKKQPMIASAIRVGIDDYGNFNGMMGNELRRRKLGKPELEYRPISEWNGFFLNLDPSKERSDLLMESMPDHRQVERGP